MADYQLTATEIVLRTADNAFIPNDSANMDRVAYEAWLAEGGVADPYVPPEPVPPAPTVEDQVLFDHENRLRVIEGEPPMSLPDFIEKMGRV